MITRATIKQFFRGDEPNIDLICGWCQALKTVEPAALTTETLSSFRRYYSSFAPVVTEIERSAMSDYLFSALLASDSGMDVKLLNSSVDHFKQWGLVFPDELQSFIQKRLDMCAVASEVLPVLAYLGHLAGDHITPPRFKTATKALSTPSDIPRGIGRALATVSILPAWSDFLKRAIPPIIQAGTKIKKSVGKTQGYQFRTHARTLLSELHCMNHAPEWTTALKSACATMSQPAQQDMLAAVSHTVSAGVMSLDGWLTASGIVIDSALERIESRVQSNAPASGVEDDEFFNRLLLAQRCFSLEHKDAALVDTQAQRLLANIDFWAPLIPTPTPNNDLGLQRLNRTMAVLPMHSEAIWKKCIRQAVPIRTTDLLKILSAPRRPVLPTYALILSNALPRNEALEVFQEYARMGEQSDLTTSNMYCVDIIEQLTYTNPFKVRPDIKDAVLQDPYLRKSFLLALIDGNVLRLRGKNADPAFPDVDFTPFVRLHRLYPCEMDRWQKAKDACYETGRSTGPSQAAFAALYEFYTGQRAMTSDSINQMAQALSMPVGDYLTMTLAQAPDAMLLPSDLDCG